GPADGRTGLFPGVPEEAGGPRGRARRRRRSRPARRPRLPGRDPAAGGPVWVGSLRGGATFPGRARARARARARVRGYEGHRRGGTTSPDREYVLNRPGFAGGRNFRGIGVMNEAKRYSGEIRERAVRLVLAPEGGIPVAVGGDRVDGGEDRLLE